jgi:hypothetical protein
MLKNGMKHKFISYIYDYKNCIKNLFLKFFLKKIKNLYWGVGSFSSADIFVF